MEAFDRLVDVVAQLRAPDGCPWDREQTFLSMLPYILEEAYELSDALRDSDLDAMREELGDVLLHVVMLSGMAAELGAFGVQNVIQDVTEKMIRRHPHVFGDTVVSSVEEVWQNWDSIKKTERQGQGVYDSIPKALPALTRAMKVQKRAAKQGVVFDPALSGIDDIGDHLFAVVQRARALGVDPEEALKRRTELFIQNTI